MGVRLEEERGNVEVTNDKFKKTQQQVETLTSELAMERSINERSDKDKRVMERRIQELTEKMAEVESTAASRSRSQLVALEAKVQTLESEYEQETQEKNAALRQCRRLEKKVAEAVTACEEEKRNTEQVKSAADRTQARFKQLRRQLEQLEEDISRERTKSRQLQRTIDELTEANETLTRENAQLKSSVALGRRGGAPRASGSRYGSDASVNRVGRSYGSDLDRLHQGGSASTAGSTGAPDDSDLPG